MTAVAPVDPGALVASDLTAPGAPVRVSLALLSTTGVNGPTRLSVTVSDAAATPVRGTVEVRDGGSHRDWLRLRARRLGHGERDRGLHHPVPRRAEPAAGAVHPGRRGWR